MNGSNWQCRVTTWPSFRWEEDVLGIIEALEADQEETATALHECELNSFDPASKEKPGRALPGALQGPPGRFGARRGGCEDPADDSDDPDSMTALVRTATGTAMKRSGWAVAKTRLPAIHSMAPQGLEAGSSAGAALRRTQTTR